MQYACMQYLVSPSRILIRRYMTAVLYIRVVYLYYWTHGGRWRTTRWGRMWIASGAGDEHLTWIKGCIRWAHWASALGERFLQPPDSPGNGCEAWKTKDWHWSLQGGCQPVHFPACFIQVSYKYLEFCWCFQFHALPSGPQNWDWLYTLYNYNFQQHCLARRVIAHWIKSILVNQVYCDVG